MSSPSASSRAFPYAGYLPPALSGLPRRDEPRLKVPPARSPSPAVRRGSIPASLPGGWHLLGRTPLRIADPDEGYFPIRAGDRIRFRADRRGRNSRPGAMSDSEPNGRDRAPIHRPERRPGRRLPQRPGPARARHLGQHLLRRPCRRSASRSARRSAAAASAGVVVGAHPGYPDREGFGRRERVRHAGRGRALILDQVAALRVLADEVGVPIRFLKPHGALYNQAQRQEEVARGVVAAAARLGLPLLGQPGTRPGDTGPGARRPLHRRGLPRPPLPRRRLAGAPE